MVKGNLYEAKELNNIRELIYNAVEKYPKNIVFTIKHQENKNVSYEDITYEKMLEDMNSFGTSLYELGLKGKRVAVVGRNRYEWVVAHFANLLGGIISVPLDKDLQVGELENLLVRSKAEAIVFDEKYIENIEAIKANGNTKISEYITMGNIEGYKNVKDLISQGKNLIEEGNKDYINAEIDDTAMNILLFTSGTTSQSKAVMLSHKNIASNVYAMQLVEKFYPNDVNIAFLPFHHIFGLTCMVVMLSSGVKTVFPDGLRYISKNLNEYHVSVFVGVPVLVEAMYKNIEKEIEKTGKTKLIKTMKSICKFLLKFKIDIRRKVFKIIIDKMGGKMRFVISGGAPLDAKVAQGFNDFGIDLVQGYGLTETAPVLCAEDLKRRRAGSIGIPMSNVDLEIVDKDENGVGEIRVKGPNIMLGYYENEEATKEVLKDGWFYTGDLAYQDKDGYIFLSGRQKNMIVLKNGKKVFPEELEVLVARIEGVKECMVFGKPDKKDKNDILLSVKIVYDEEVRNGKFGDLSDEDFSKHIWEQVKELNKTLPRYKYIKNMILTKEELIKTTTKKVKRQDEIKKILEEE